MEELQGRVAVVTGAASGIGLAMARRFAEEGMRVVLADVEATRLEQAAGELTAAGHDVRGIPCDVSRWESVEALAADTLDTFGAVHVLCNNAGVASPPGPYLWEGELTTWHWMWGVNVMGIVHGIRAFVPIMLKQGDAGHVVNTSSGNGGIAPFRALPVYASTKAALTQISECLYGQLAAVTEQIGVSVLFPGPHWLDTNLWTAERNRPQDLARDRPVETYSFESLKAQMTAAGEPFVETPLDEIAAFVVAGIRERRFWLIPEAAHIDAKISARADSMLGRQNPSYMVEERLAIAGGLGSKEE